MKLIKIWTQSSGFRMLWLKGIVLFIVTITLLSCTKMAMRMVSKIYKKPDVHYITDGDKIVAYIAMVHLNKKEFFDNAKSTVDSLRKQGYSIFYESVKMSAETDTLVQDTVYRKFRKIGGIHLTSYDNVDNKSIKKYQLNGLIAQTQDNTGVNSMTDIRADIPLDSIIKLFELDKGKILLSDCDYKTPLNDKYNCSSVSKNIRDYLMLSIRNRVLADKIQSDNHSKIAVIYGLLHYKGVLEELQKRNSEWHKVQ